MSWLICNLFWKQFPDDYIGNSGYQCEMEFLNIGTLEAEKENNLLLVCLIQACEHNNQVKLNQRVDSCLATTVSKCALEPCGQLVLHFFN